MKKLIANPITAWSYSRFAVFRECRLHFKFQFIDKLPQPEGPAMARGNQVHAALQAYIEKKTRKLPADLVASMGGELGARYQELRASKTVACELELAVNSKWQRVEWYAKDAWLRAKFDVVETIGDSVYVGDHKTGKIYPKHAEQLENYSLLVPSFWPDAGEIIAQMLYVDQGQVSSPAVFTRTSVMKLRKKWEKLVAPIFKERLFKATPSPDACRFCAYSRRRGGPCVQG